MPHHHKKIPPPLLNVNMGLNQSDPMTSEAYQRLLLQDAENKIKVKQEKLNTAIANRKQREKYGQWIFFFVIANFVVTIFFISFENILKFHDKEVMTFMYVAVANTFGLLFIVIKYLFNEST